MKKISHGTHYTGCKLPSLRDILRTCFFFYIVQSEGTQTYAFNTCKLDIKYILSKHVSSQLQSRIDECKALKKNQS